MSYIFALAIIIGYIMVIRKNRIGFLVQLAGCLGMIGLYLGIDGGVLLVNAVFACVNIWGFFKWKAQQKISALAYQKLLSNLVFEDIKTDDSIISKKCAS